MSVGLCQQPKTLNAFVHGTRQPGSRPPGTKIIYDGCGQLKNFPNMGRASRRMSGRRELAFPPLPYIAVYKVKEHAVEMSRIFHGAQDWP
ncbi:MAG TPA: type II toxin-antitoxin system RelE/ParE family toxin [Bryobacteraceae bacterium]|nr:type II toxin-antitoxin system RelE/ParE family toxin [Bryobacteraceae bacterium]